MSWISTAAGVVLIAVGLNEVFHTVLHPTGRGRLTHFAAIWTWRLSSGLGRRGRSLAGPLATVATVLVWVGFQVVGWTLVYLPHVPDGFAYSPGIRLDEYPAVLEAFYFSVVSMSTLGLGDVYPVEPWLRVVAPLQALIGFALLTAAVAWFLELYPGLGRRRALALRIALMERADVASHLPEMESGTASALLDTLTADLAQVRVDLWQNAESHYFTEEDPATSLAATLPYALRLARVGRESSDRTVQNSGHMLEGAIDDFAALASDRFIPGQRGTEAILLEYARQHRQRPSQRGAVSESPEG
jgi:hypothetical protein